MKQVKYLNFFFIYDTKYFLSNFNLNLTRYLKEFIQTENFFKFPELQWITLLGDIRAEDNFIRVTNLCERRLTAPNITARLNQCRGKCVTIHNDEKILWS